MCDSDGKCGHERQGVCIMIKLPLIMLHNLCGDPVWVLFVFVDVGSWISSYHLVLCRCSRRYSFCPFTLLVPILLVLLRVSKCVPPRVFRLSAFYPYNPCSHYSSAFIVRGSGQSIVPASFLLSFVLLREFSTGGSLPCSAFVLFWMDEEG